ncbi:MAG: hypothetical protein AAF149_11605 [Bacteroidota bacterium]
MKVYCLISVLVGMAWSVPAMATSVQVQKSDNGFKLVVDGQDFMVKGINWDYYPLGTNYTYSLWEQSEAVIKSVLDKEMTLVKSMGVNTLRMYKGIPKKWIAYIHQNFGIYTMLNHPFGRYGVSLDGEWMANTEYDNPGVKELLLKKTAQLAKEYRDTPGLLLYLLGNENNYGLFWDDTEKKTTPKKDYDSALPARAMYKLFLLSDNKGKSIKEKSENELSVDEKSVIRARSIYELFNEAALAMKALDSQHPIAICNGDLMFIEIIKEECKDIDIFGTNMYRGVSFGDTFQRVREELNKPIIFTEFGADAYNAIEGLEDQESQAYYLAGNWKEIYANVAGIGGSGNSLGGFTYQFSDGWWKVGQTKNLAIHDNTATWNNGGYYRDDKGGVNNMNEEWFGICSKIRSNAQGEYDLLPRAAYFVLRLVHSFSPYDPTATLVELEKHFLKIDIPKAINESKGYSNSLKKMK